MNQPEGTLNITYELYRTLGVRPPCTEDQLTKAYRKAALKYHPDKANGCPEKFQQAKVAYDILKDPIKREYYDRTGDKALEFLLSEEYKALGVNDTSTFFGRFCIQVMTKPTRLAPYFAFIASIDIIFIIFINFLDKKLYYSGLKGWSWELIFTFFWFDAIFFVLLFGFFLYLKFKRIKNIYEYSLNSDKLKDIPMSTRKYLVPLMTLKSLMSDFYFFLLTVAVTSCTFKLAFSLDDDGHLFKGSSWMKVFDPVIIVFVLYGGVYFLLTLLTIFKYRNPQRLWSERSLILANEAYDTFANIIFVFSLPTWLDSTDRNKFHLFLIFSIFYVKIIFDSFRIYTAQKWKYLDEKEILLAKLGRNDAAEDVEAKFNSLRRIFKILMGVAVFFAILQVALINLHLSGFWPNSWSMALSPILVCVFCSVLLFGCCFPCIIVCMDYAVPQNSFDQYFGPGESSITIIEILSPRFRYGYGLAPLQQRIK